MKYKNTLGFILVALLATSCANSSERINNELKEWKLRGPVKTITETDYSNTGKYTTNLSFNASGFIQEQASYNHDGSLIRRWKYEYNNKRQKITRTTFVIKDSLSEILHYAYNQTGKLAQETLLHPGMGVISVVKHEYDAEQKEITTRFLDGKGKIQGGILFKYDNKDNVIEELHYDSVYSQNVKQQKKYNSDGLNVEILYLSMNDSLLRRITNVYLPKRLVGETCIYYGKNELVSKTTFEYDKQVNIISKQIYSSEDKSTENHTFKYTYDKYNNWTSRNEFVNNEAVDMITRKLDYY